MELEQEPKIKKGLFGFVIITIIVSSILKAITMIKATMLYSTLGYPWYDTLSYVVLCGFFLCPILALFFLDSVHIRRGLRLYLLGMILLSVLEFGQIFGLEAAFTGIDEGETFWTAGHMDVLFQFDRPLNALLMVIDSCALIICWLFLFRQIHGYSPLAVKIRTAQQGWNSGIQNLKNFIERPKSSSKKRVNGIIIVNIIIFLGLLIPMLPENSSIILDRPENHKMKVRFWTSGPSQSNGFNNSTLEIMGANQVELYSWIGFDYYANGSAIESQPAFEAAVRYGKFNVSFYKQQSIPEDETEWTGFYHQVEEMLNWCDAHPEVPFKGLIADWERAQTIAQYNTSHYIKYCDFIQNVSNYMADRGYAYAICETLNTIGDLYDGDNDMAIAYGDPFDPVLFENISAINWMVYRSEERMFYDEPYAYFTHQWAKASVDYLSYCEQEFGYTPGFWTNKTELSLGVTGTKMYTYNADLRGYEASLDEIILDAQICHANRIGGISIFYSKNGSHFQEMWGDAGLTQFFSELNSYDQIEIPYKHRASFFGNLKWLSNITGSVHGILYSDALYDAWFGYLGLIYIGALLIGPWFFIKLNLPKIKYEYKTYKDEDDREKADILTKIIRISYFVLIGLIFILAFFYLEILPVPKEIFLNLDGI